MSISDFADMMPHTVSHEVFSTRDAYGAKSYGSATNYSARVLYKQKLIRDKDGNEVVAMGTVWFLGSPTIGPEDRVTLPDGSTPPILNTELYSDENGSYFSKVYFG